MGKSNQGSHYHGTWADGLSLMEIDMVLIDNHESKVQSTGPRSPP